METESNMVAAELPVRDSVAKEGTTRILAMVAAAMIVVAIAMLFSGVAWASDTDLAGNIVSGLQGVYDLIRTIATPIAIVSLAVALIISFFSHNQKNVDMSRQVAKGIIVTWIILMCLGPIFNFASGLLNSSDLSTNSSLSTFQ